MSQTTTQPPALISEEYWRMQQRPQENPDYGVPSVKWPIDFLEQIEPYLLDNVLDDLTWVTAGMGVFIAHSGPAVKVLPDDRNAHLIQHMRKGSGLEA